MPKVLIVEDELQLLENMRTYLMSFKGEFQVLTAGSGEEGLAQLLALSGKGRAVRVSFGDHTGAGSDKACSMERG